MRFRNQELTMTCNADWEQRGAELLLCSFRSSRSAAGDKTSSTCPALFLIGLRMLLSGVLVRYLIKFLMHLFGAALPRVCISVMQRRCYWLLEGNGDIVLVHYLSLHPTAHASVQGAVQVDRPEDRANQVPAFPLQLRLGQSM